jgi:hypothetical protein
MPNLPMNAAAFYLRLFGSSRTDRILFNSHHQQKHRYTTFLKSRKFYGQAAGLASSCDGKIETLIDDLFLITRVGKENRLDQVHKAMSYDAAHGPRPILLF